MNIEVNYDITAEFQNCPSRRTVAMWLASNNLDIPEKWKHEPSI